MKVIIMAAGRGTRISRHINDKPKCLVEISEGLTLIEYTIKLLQKKGIVDIVVITGYKSDEIKKVLKNQVRYYENCFFDITNSLVSLWFAKEEINSKDDLILMNGDVFLEESLLEDIIAYKKDITVFSDENRKEDADYKLFYKNSVLKKYGKELELQETTGEYIGVIKILKNEHENIKNKLAEMIKKQMHFLWWENIIYTMSEEREIYVKNVENKFWAEVDYIEDYIRIKEFIKENKEKSDYFNGV